MGLSRADKSVKIWQNLPVCNPKPDLHSINAHIVWWKSINYHPESKIWACLGQMSVKICPLAIPNQIFTIAMHIPSLVKIGTYQVWWKSIDVYSSYHLETKYGRMDKWTDRYTDIQRETIIPRHYRVAGYKKTVTVFSEKTDVPPTKKFHLFYCFDHEN